MQIAICGVGAAAVHDRHDYFPDPTQWRQIRVFNRPERGDRAGHTIKNQGNRLKIHK